MTQCFSVAMAAFGWLAACWFFAPKAQSIWYYDAPVYLSIAYDINHEGRFTAGSNWATPYPDTTRPPAMSRSPLDPYFLSWAARLDPAFGSSLDCLVGNSLSPACPDRAPLPRLLQFLMMVGVLIMLWRMAWRVTGSPRTAWLTLGLAAFTGPTLVHYAQTLMTETLCLLFTTAATFAGVEAMKSGRPLTWSVFAGVMTALAALTRPNFLYFFPVVAIAALALCLRRPGARRSLLALALYLAVGLGVMTPWLIRNEMILGHFALTSDYAAMAITQRVAYDEMGWRQFAVFNLCSLPDGVAMTKSLIGPAACDPFGYEIKPDRYYGIGSTVILNNPAVIAGGTGYVIRHYILGNPLWHLCLCLPMALRGLEIDHYWGFVLALPCLVLTLKALRARDAAMLIITLPGWFMLAFYAAFSADQTRYNLMMIMPFSLSGAMFLRYLINKTPLRIRFWTKKSAPAY